MGTLALRPVVLVGENANHPRALSAAVALHLNEHRKELGELRACIHLAVEAEHDAVAAAHVVPQALVVFGFDLESLLLGHPGIASCGAPNAAPVAPRFALRSAGELRRAPSLRPC